jgi:hypothetical protein
VYLPGAPSTGSLLAERMRSADEPVSGRRLMSELDARHDGPQRCWDTAAAESFSSTFKTEFYDRHHWESMAEARTASGVLDRGTLQPPPALLDRHAHPSTLRSTPTSDGISRLIASPPFGVNLSSVRRASSSFVIHRAWEPYVYFLPSDTLQGINHPVRLRHGQPDTGFRSREQFSREARAPLREHIR